MSQSPLMSKYGQLFQSQKYSDLVLLCQEKEFKVHKAIVCTQSPVLTAACDGLFKEAVSNVIHVEGFDPDTVERMLLFIYTQTYHQGSLKESSSTSIVKPDSQQEMDTSPESKEDFGKADPKAAILESLLSDVKMNAIADYYDIPELKRRANERIENTINTSWLPQSLPIVLREVFDSTSDKYLHNVLSDTIIEHADEVVELIEDIASLDIMSDFAIDIIRKMILKNKSNRDKLIQSVQDLESQLRETKSGLEWHKQKAEQERQRADQAQNSVRRFNELLKQPKKCWNPNCRTEFMCYMDGTGPYYLYCGRCNWKYE